MIATRKLIREREDFEQNAPDYIYAEPMKNNIFHWRATVLGPSDTPFEGGIFILDIICSDEYPFKPPKCTIKTNMFHPNISSIGKIYIRILEDDWRAVLTIENILLSILSILDTPVMDNPINHEAARYFRENRREYNSIVREYTLKYANEFPILNENEQNPPSDPDIVHTEVNHALFCDIHNEDEQNLPPAPAMVHTEEDDLKKLLERTITYHQFQEGVISNKSGDIKERRVKDAQCPVQLSSQTTDNMPVISQLQSLSTPNFNSNEFVHATTIILNYLKTVLPIGTSIADICKQFNQFGEK
ncbi:unnamed protein product [Adineta steineri]|uniref:UBC core domain-containing protein n=1 Tax=Adineta steineri TaxID=433720 RepID=A0A819SYP8_9BILA|nr:unnamed protein product [Adineta steineri]CAF4067690.1 unnamed protein product [Adineta steineri]